MVNSNPKMFKYDMVWDKKKGSNPLLARKRINKSHENILLFYNKPPVFHWEKYHTIKSQDEIITGFVGGCFYAPSPRINRRYEPILPLSVMEYSKIWGNKRKHATEKPVGLLEHLIKYYTDDNAVVLDPTMGSGTTGKACQNLGRRFIGIEIDKAIYDTAVERLNESQIKNSC